MYTHQAHYRNTSGTHQAQRFDRISEKIIHVPFVCLMCASTFMVLVMLKNENYRQFPFQRCVPRQNRTFLAPCGSILSSVIFHEFGHFWLVLSNVPRGGHISLFYGPPWAFFGGSTYKCFARIKSFLGRLECICSSELKT